MSYYKVWIHIEKISDEEDVYQDVGLPKPVGEFDTLSEAEVLVARLQEATEVES